MPSHPRFITLALLTAILPGGAILSYAAQPAPEPSAERLAQRIASALEAERVAEADAEARRAVERYPASPLLHQRLAQVHVCRAIERGTELERALQDAVYSERLRRLVEHLHQGPGPALDSKPERRERFEQLRTFASGPVVIQFQEQALEGLRKSESQLQQRSQALVEAFAALKEARRLGDAGSELELTDLWAQVLPLFWRQEPEKLRGLGKERLAVMEKALAPFEAIQPVTVLRAAAALAKQRAEDPSALAGAADVISVVAGIAKKPDPLGDRTRTILERRYMQNAEVYEPSLSTAGMERARQLYTRFRDAQEPDVLTAPATVALQLYQRALQKDSNGSLPYLRLRVYLLRVAFDGEAARPLLEEIRRREPGNAVVPMEQARAAFLLEGKPVEGLAHLQEAARLPGYSRSYLVAVPAPLRTSLKYQRQLRDWIGRAWPGHGWMFNTLDEMQHPWEAPALLRAQRQLYEELAQRTDVGMLYLRLADRLCQAPDYADQAVGIGHKYSILDRMASLAGKQEQPALELTLRRQQEEHRRAFAWFPRTRSWLQFSLKGLNFLESPSTSPSGFSGEGLCYMLSPDFENFFGIDG